MDFAFPVAVLGLGLLMLGVHIRSWRRIRSLPLGPEEREFRATQLRRRAQSSSLLALVGAAMIAGLRLDPLAWPWLFVSLWSLIAFATAWVAVLAILDALASGSHYRSLSRARAAARAKLAAEFEQQAAAARGLGSSAQPSE